MVLEQFDAAMRKALWDCLCECSKSRPLWFVSMDATPEGVAKVRLGKFRDGNREARQVANAHPHGRWLEWLGAD
jgi:hypothetical protein